ncbi:gamma carbonic anhydrase family protein [Ferrovibrio sp.]|uniref:gamma carbonic anhydrase family protein n=1 Tax=Ferrovibrio sp. TaxID=1917215 RepID=UPI003D2BF8AC
MPIHGPDVVLNDPAYIHETAHIYGKVRLEKGSSVWINVAMRAENFEIVVGEYTNIQDFSMIHIGGQTATHIGSHCSITHHCNIHGCTIGDNCLIGIGATIMDGCVIGNNCIIGGAAFLKEGTVIPDNSVVVGAPGKVIKTQNNYVRNRLNAYLYYRNALAYKQGQYREWDQPETLKAIGEEIARLNAELKALDDGTRLMGRA